ncbi:MAG: CDP-alcohol phosphatidyltransferase family protein [Candidatus Magasanikbacteria bacterium]
MKIINRFKESHKDMFEYLPAEKVLLHDTFLDRILLRFLPKSITPNGLSLFRILATPVVFLVIIYGNYTIGIIAFVLVAFTDAIDGSMARTQNKITLFGKLIDPLADKLFIGSMVILLVFTYFHYWMGIAILGLEIAIIAGAVLMKVKFKTVKSANRWGKIKMIFQCAAVFATLIALLIDFPVLMTVAAGLFGFAIGFAILSLFTGGI